MVFAAFAVLYGFCETMNGNWSQLDVTSLGVQPAIASLALTGFWAVVTAGRVLLAAIQRWLPSRAAYHGLPFLLAVAFVLIAVLPSHAPAPAVAAFCLAGLGCSVLLPLTISFGQRKLADRQAMVAGGVIACYQVGYGLAAFGVGPLTSAGVRLPTIFAASAAVAAVMGGLSLAVAHRQPSPAAVHPRPLYRLLGVSSRIVPVFALRQQADGLVRPPAAPGVGVHRDHVPEHGVDDPPGRLHRVLRSEQPALPVERGADEPVVGEHVGAGVFGEVELLGLGQPARTGLLADQGEADPVLAG